MQIIFYRDLYNPAVYGQALEGEVKDVPDDVAKQLIAHGTAGQWFEHKIPSSAGLVSCIMPTKNRREYVPRAIACFLAQTYEKKELIVLDNGDPVADLMPKNSMIKYMRLNSQQTTGHLRNFCCQMASGEFIAHWDDDDWSHPRRLEEQVAALGDKAVTGYQKILFHGPKPGDFHKYSGAHEYAVGTSLLYRRDWWERNRFKSDQVGEDTDFVTRARGNIVVTDGTGRLVAATHAKNTSPRKAKGDEWVRVSISSLPEGYQS